MQLFFFKLKINPFDLKHHFTFVLTSKFVGIQIKKLKKLWHRSYTTGKHENVKYMSKEAVVRPKILIQPKDPLQLQKNFCESVISTIWIIIFLFFFY